MLAGALLALVQNLGFPVIAVLALAFAVVLIGLRGVISKLGNRMPRIPRLASVVSKIGAVAALGIPLAVIMALVVPMNPDVGWLVLGAVVLFLAVLVAAVAVGLIVVGTAVRRAGIGRPAGGPLLIAGGLLSLILPLSRMLGLRLSDRPWLDVLVLGGLAAIFFAIGSAFPSDDSAPKAPIES